MHSKSILKKHCFRRPVFEAKSGQHTQQFSKENFRIKSLQKSLTEKPLQRKPSKESLRNEALQRKPYIKTLQRTPQKQPLRRTSGEKSFRKCALCRELCNEGLVGTKTACKENLEKETMFTKNALLRKSHTKVR